MAHSGQIEEALVEAEAAQKLAHMYHDQLRPQAEATLQSSVIAYENDKTDLLDLLDSQMTVVNIDLAWLQAVADFDTRLADLELATGTSLDQSDTHRNGGETVKTRGYQICIGGGHWRLCFACEPLSCTCSCAATTQLRRQLRRTRSWRAGRR